MRRRRVQAVASEADDVSLKLACVSVYATAIR